MFLEPKSINGFLAIIDNGNFDKAAKILNITTSALSIRVSSLRKPWERSSSSELALLA
ncbi:LysR family transcriptional regulator [Rouxiella chamberiensis]|uniref:LysR family transcriptional regulator n=1 Tax=Rouxiella chamberiensis TaxID=1513468 RepID=A0ABY7HP15_9GAMM|nr:LysR family transcriptional regulator [Rouxiella chamberiensis]WAT00782.1 LysR family transcriptional regulator [Rouxiella chamberiensis]